MTCKAIKLLAIFGVVFMLGSGAQAVELLTDGGFDSVLEYWSVDSSFDSWLPYDHTTGAISLNTPIWGYHGGIVSQPLNIDGIANKTVQVSIDVAGPEWGGLSTNDAVSVELEYLTLAGVRETVTVVSSDNSMIPDNNFVTFNNTYIFPADADRLVEFQISLTSDDYDILVDSASLTSSEGLVAGPLPVLRSITPSSVAYGETATLNGSLFGSVEGVVRVDGETNGVNIVSWSDNAIEITVDSTCEDGMVEVEVDGTCALRQRELEITSPHYRLEVHAGQRVVLAGQQIEVDLLAEFENSFSTVDGIAFSVPDYPGAATFTSNPLMRQGGSLLNFDTTGMSPGLHTVSIIATETNLPPREASFELDVRQVASCTLDVDGSTFTAQSPVTASIQVTDTLGNDISYDLPKPTWSSSAPTQIDVFQEPSDWGSLYLLPHATGSAVIQATLADGSTHNFNVSSVIPATTSILNHSCLIPTMSNDPADTNQLVTTASEPMTYYYVSVSDLSWITQDSWWNVDNSQHTYEFTVSEDTEPGKYLFAASVDMAGGSAGEGCVLTVVNNPSTGLIEGRMVQFGGDMMHGASGMMEFYDAVGGEALFTNEVWSFSANYTIASVPPGSYKLRFVNDDSEGQWYPNAESNTASTVVVTAGGTVSDINFAFAGFDEGIPDPDIVDPPSYDSATGTFGFSVQTDSTENYHLLKSANLHEGSWYSLETIWGDGSAVSVSDTNAQSSSAFYRVVVD